ncbi:NAD-dependent epimerase/dehydratase family protein [Treponema primitia]|uniref:NAD-dependent epimerase/dehydratase family protein n=1 Tax=Treponema primitia TaxID=88058 RepID=UPI0002554D63|nr:NAD-dependent epimerase/dehydratase family protein [Treponema primitia]
MKIIIIGSKGFIGSHCVSYFSKQNNDVWESDIVVDSKNNNKYYSIDTISPDFSVIFKAQQFDVCVNCSGAANVPESFVNPLKDYHLNTVNVFRILNSLRQFNSKCKFINLSSAAVYGSPKKLPISEDMMMNPISPYGWHKQQAEIISKEFFLLYGIQTINLRIFSVYGVGLRKQIFWDIFQKVKNSDNIELFGTGNESRDFIYIEDLVRAIDHIIKFAEFNSEAINISSGIETTIKEAATLLCKNIRDNINIIFNQQIREGDPINWRSDINKLTSYGFVNNYSLEMGIKELAKWLKENI